MWLIDDKLKPFKFKKKIGIFSFLMKVINADFFVYDCVGFDCCQKLFGLIR